MKVSRHVAIMMDVKGPEIRTGSVVTPIELNVGDLFEFFVVITNALAHNKIIDTLQLREVE